MIIVMIIIIIIIDIIKYVSFAWSLTSLSCRETLFSLWPYIGSRQVKENKNTIVVFIVAVLCS